MLFFISHVIYKKVDIPSTFTKHKINCNVSDELMVFQVGNFFKLMIAVDRDRFSEHTKNILIGLKLTETLTTG